VPLLKHPEVTWPLVPLNTLGLVAQYAEKLFWPWPLSVAYPFHSSAALSEPRVLAGMLVLLAFIALFVSLTKRSRVHAFALLWIFLTLAPALNARWMATYVFAERNLYLASVGFSWLVAAGILWLWRREGAARNLQRAALTLVCTVVALLAAGATLAHNRDFRDDGVLFTRTLALYPDAALIRSNLATWHWNRGLREEAEQQWRLALRDDPQNFFALSNLGMALLEKECFAEAKVVLQRAITVRPKFSAAHLHFARVYAAQGLGVEAEKEFRLALDSNPFSTAARNFFAKFYLDTGRLDEAAAQFRASLESIPTSDAWAGLAEVYSGQNSLAQAEHAWKEAIQLNPFATQAHFALGKLYLASGRLAEAEKELRAGLLMDPNNAEALAALREISAHTTRQR